MIGPWQITGAVVGAVVIFGAGFWSGYEFRDGQAAQDELETEEQNTEALLQRIEKLRAEAAEAREDEAAAAGRVTELEAENAALRTNHLERISRVEISDHCSLCVFGPDAAGVLVDAASGSRTDPQRRRE